MDNNATKDKEFMKHVVIRGECWVWNKRANKDFYAEFKGVRAHRYAYQAFVGHLPAEALVCHKCDNPPCVRPSHLFLGTAADNTRDMMAKGRHGARKHPENWARGEKHGCAILTPELVLAIREEYAAGGISCRALGEKYGVKGVTVQAITSRRLWKHI
jgi:hypothetical protein